LLIRGIAGRGAGVISSVEGRTSPPWMSGLVSQSRPAPRSAALLLVQASLVVGPALFVLAPLLLGPTLLFSLALLFGLALLLLLRASGLRLAVLLGGAAGLLATRVGVDRLPLGGLLKLTA